MVYIISYYLNFLKDVSKLTLYTPLDAPTLNHDHEIDNEMERIIFRVG
jgi:hypothetical protein